MNDLRALLRGPVSFTPRGLPTRLSAAFALAVVSLIASRAFAAERGVDVVLRDPPPPRRVVSLEFNPAALLVSRVSANVEIAPVDHHTLIVSPYYFYPRTSSFNRVDSNGNYTIPVPSQKFEGFGVEIGYRYYTGLGGMRGFFVGPSLILEWPKATASDQSTTSFADLGVALDVGYQTLVANDWSVGLGAGLQYVNVSKTLPGQQMPASIYANSGVEPRILFALGRAF